MMRHTLASALAISMLTSAAPALADHSGEEDAVTVDPVSVSGCGSQSLTFTGTGMYSEPTQHLVVTLDGTGLLHDHSEPATWTAGPVTVEEGSHTVTARIHDRIDAGDGHEIVRAEATRAFTVPSCAPSPTPSTPAPSSSAPSSGAGTSSDCCPGGPDTGTPASAVKAVTVGKVKAVATVRKLPGKLVPLNSIFRKVYGRSPTFQEWEYWARRLLSDKPTYDALYGAMQWHQRLGHTMMPPVGK